MKHLEAMELPVLQKLLQRALSVSVGDAVVLW
jgi:hypothetical protein